MIAENWSNSSHAHKVLFFFQAEDGIRDLIVTGVQTCALPISGARPPPALLAVKLMNGEPAVMVALLSSSPIAPIRTSSTCVVVAVAPEFGALLVADRKSVV